MKTSIKKIEGSSFKVGRKANAIFDIDFEKGLLSVTIDFTISDSHSQLNEDIQDILNDIGATAGELANVYAELAQPEPDRIF